MRTFKIYNYEEKKHPYDYFNYDDHDWLSHVELFSLCLHVSLKINELLHYIFKCEIQHVYTDY